MRIVSILSGDKSQPVWRRVCLKTTGTWSGTAATGPSRKAESQRRRAFSAGKATPSASRNRLCITSAAVRCEFRDATGAGGIRIPSRRGTIPFRRAIASTERLTRRSSHAQGQNRFGRGSSKLNFNACIYADGLPVTLRFAGDIGEILAAIPEVSSKPLPFRHYI
jgi:hypothetical protein